MRADRWVLGTDPRDKRRKVWFLLRDTTHGYIRLFWRTSR